MPKTRVPHQFSHQGHEKIDTTKKYLCDLLRRSASLRGFSTRDMAIMLGTSQSCTSRVLRYKTEDLTLNQLFCYLAILEPQFEILIAF